MLLAVSAAGLAVGCVGKVRPEGLERRDYTVDPAYRFKKVSLENLVHHPMVDFEAEFDALFCREDETIWQPHFTLFRSEEYKSFSAWLPDARLWEPSGYAASVPTLFIHRESRLVSVLGTLSRYTPVRVQGVVRSIFGQRAWIEVFSLTPLGSPRFTDDSLARLSSGLEELKNRQAHARQNLQEALEGTLGPAGKAAAHNGLGWIALDRRDYEAAEEHYAEALYYSPMNEEAQEGLKRARNKMAPAALPERPPSDAQQPPPLPDADEGDRPQRELEALRQNLDNTTRALATEQEVRQKSEAATEALQKQVEARDAEIRSLTEQIAERDRQIQQLREQIQKLEEEKPKDD